MKLSLTEYLSVFNEEANISSLTGFGRGIEREALRVLAEGKLSEKPHAYNLGSALTNPYITTDYSETLLEFITPVNKSPEDVIAQLQDIQKFTLSRIDGELLWPMSMPCFVDDANKIPLAQYGSSNIGKMKTVYRQGLKNRYGSMMQVISGIHFNFSFPDSFWSVLQTTLKDKQPRDEFVSERYFSLLRNYKRFCWLIPYLYGSSPSICSSFLQNKPQALPFKKSPKGYLYLEHATSLRMSDLGYTNNEQSSLSICYNHVDTYVEAVKKAINLSSDKFAQIGVKVDGKYQQLNANVLQIENELYAPVRPKRVAKAGEKPSEALSSRGVEYIEVRALDVNPFVDTGVSLEQVYFLDVFLMYCALTEHDYLDGEKQKIYENNMDEVVLRGRDPELRLCDNGEHKSVKQWGNSIFDEMLPIAKLLDKANGTTKYQQVLSDELDKINNPELTPSAKVIDLLVNQNKSLTQVALSMAQTYRDGLLAQDYNMLNEQDFIDSVNKSHKDQQVIEAADIVNFDQFLVDYFAR
ncbi:glutamate--cysteine ligase [Colwellia sp. UCD-KL20]|uniref:glutamate--cysteine ligase n=1 Tax=Colwellia sp. UCD-KL20 TaxID=1917165 RepID=UPI0009F84A51|nr:glutamate--cysteine ligase [Colwellia sp. UCD-KL20]